MTFSGIVGLHNSSYRTKCHTLNFQAIYQNLFIAEHYENTVGVTITHNIILKHIKRL